MATEKCFKCLKPVYLNEKIKSSKAQVYHKSCFRCLDCNIALGFAKDHVGPDLQARCKPCFEAVYGRNGSIIAQTITSNHRPSEAPTAAQAIIEEACTLEEDLKEIKEYIDKKKWLKASDLISILPNNTALKGQGFLVSAAMNNATLDVFEACLDFGSEVDEVVGSVTALFCSVGRRNVEAIQLLLDRGADVNALDKYGRSPLWVGCKNNATVVIAKMLINKGANVNQADIDQKCPLNVSVSMHQPLDFIQVLLDTPQIDINFRDRDGFSSLHEAFVDVQVLELLLKRGADVHSCSNRGETVMHTFAINSAPLQAFQLLLDFGFSRISQKDEVGARTPLLLACGNNCSSEVLTLLIASGASVTEEVDAFGRGSLFYAAQANQDLDVIKLLIEHGAKPEASGFEQGESLVETYRQRDFNSPVVEWLLQQQQ